MCDRGGRPAGQRGKWAGVERRRQRAAAAAGTDGRRAPAARPAGRKRSQSARAGAARLPGGCTPRSAQPPRATAGGGTAPAPDDACAGAWNASTALALLQLPPPALLICTALHGGGAPRRPHRPAADSDHARDHFPAPGASERCAFARPPQGALPSAIEAWRRSPRTAWEPAPTPWPPPATSAWRRRAPPTSPSC